MRFSIDFFKEEEREGFVVPEMMKRAWAAAMEVLDVIRTVCRKYDIRYYAFYGTLLGAERHRGFIPWDDDIDICMLRDDYDRFMKIAPEALPEGFVVSGIYGRDERLWEANQEPQGRVIADETFFTLPRYMNYFHGYPYPRIGVDIFPLDYIYDDTELQYRTVKLVNDVHFVVANWKLFKENGTIEARVRDLEKQLKIEAGSWDQEVVLKHELRLAADRLAASADRKKASRVADVLYCKPAETIEKYIPIRGMHPDVFGMGKPGDFEQIKISIPENPGEVLRTIYGENYMIPKKFTAGHEYPFYRTQETAFVNLLREAGVETPVDEFCRNWHKANGGE